MARKMKAMEPSFIVPINLPNDVVVIRATTAQAETAREMLAEVRFRPAVRPDGTPVRDTVQITAEAPR